MLESISLESEIAALIVNTLHLPTAPADIVPDRALFREGLGLDSIDALELSLAISKTYGFQLRSDDPDITRIFASLRSLAAAVAERRTK